MSVTSSYSGSPSSSPRVSVGLGSTSTRALAVVTNKWYREQRRAELDVTRSLTLLKQRKISCILKVESMQRGLGREESKDGVENIVKELEDVEKKMLQLEKDREDKCKKIMDRRVQQVNTLQELGLLEAVGKESMRSRTDLEAKENDIARCSPALSTSKYSPASSSSSHASRRTTPPLLLTRYRAGSDPSISRPDPSSRLDPGGGEERAGKSLGSKLSPRLGRRNPLRMLSNAIDFRTRRKPRPKSADFESVDETDGKSRTSSGKLPTESFRSISVTDILETVNSNSNIKSSATLPPRILEGRNSAPDILPPRPGDLKEFRPRSRTRLSAAASAKQKLSTRFQPQRKPAHRIIQTSSVKRAKTFSLGGGTHPVVTVAYKTLPKLSSSRSLGSSSTDSCQSSQSTASSRKSSNSSSLSDNSESREISEDALQEIAAFEKFIEEYFENCDNNNHNNQTKVKIGKVPVHGIKMKPKLSTCSTLSEVLELSI